MPWGVSINEAPHDTQEDAGTPEGQVNTAGECESVVYQVPCKDYPCVYTGVDRETLWGE